MFELLFVLIFLTYVPLHLKLGRNFALEQGRKAYSIGKADVETWEKKHKKHMDPNFPRSEEFAIDKSAGTAYCTHSWSKCYKARPERDLDKIARKAYSFHVIFWPVVRPGMFASQKLHLPMPSREELLPYDVKMAELELKVKELESTLKIG